MALQPIERSCKRRNDWLWIDMMDPKIWALVATFVFGGGGAAYTLWDTSATVAKVEGITHHSNNRITRLEEALISIRESLGEIKQDLRGINEKLDRK